MKDFSTFIGQINSNLDNFDGEKVCDYLSEPRQVGALIHAAENGRPALEGCVQELERLHGGLPGCDLSDDTVRQSVGKIVAAILKEYGYQPGIHIPLKIETQWFTSASLYDFQP